MGGGVGWGVSEECGVDGMGFVDVDEWWSEGVIPDGGVVLGV